MKHILTIICAALLLGTTGCGTHDDNEFVVQGTTTQDRLNGVQVFIVPCDPMSPMFTSKAFEDSIGVDSVYIRDNKFEFRGHGEYLARITVDKHKRMGTQDLLVITEPGRTATVVIDSISSGGGTPQNDALQQWKERLEAYSLIAGPASQYIFQLRQMGDSVHARQISDSLAVCHRQLNADVRDIASRLGHGIAYDLLMHRHGD